MNPFKIAKGIKRLAKVAKFRQIWSHCALEMAPLILTLRIFFTFSQAVSLLQVNLYYSPPA